MPTGIDAVPAVDMVSRMSTKLLLNYVGRTNRALVGRADTTRMG